MGVVYCAGPMRGYPAFNFPAFFAAADRLRADGWTVLNPAEHDKDGGFDETQETLEGFDLHAAFRWDIEAVLRSDAIYMLAGWELSTGANIEHSVAKAIGLEVLYEEPLPVIIGLSGYARAGKDTFGAFLVENHGFERISFADGIRSVAYACNPMISGVSVNRKAKVIKLRTLVDTIGWERAKEWSGVRQFLQHLGTEGGREILGENVWVDAALRRARPGGKYVVTDVRYPNEADAIKALGGRVLRIERPGYGPANGHVSETAMDEHDFDGLIRNDGSVHDLQRVAAWYGDQPKETTT